MYVVGIIASKDISQYCFIFYYYTYCDSVKFFFFNSCTDSPPPPPFFFSLFCFLLKKKSLFYFSMGWANLAQIVLVLGTFHYPTVFVTVRTRSVLYLSTNFLNDENERLVGNILVQNMLHFYLKILSFYFCQGHLNIS